MRSKGSVLQGSAAFPAHSPVCPSLQIGLKLALKSCPAASRIGPGGQVGLRRMAANRGDRMRETGLEPFRVALGRQVEIVDPDALGEDLRWFGKARRRNVEEDRCQTGSQRRLVHTKLQSEAAKLGLTFYVYPSLTCR